MALTDIDSQRLGDSVSDKLGDRNLIINGAMTVAQRGTTDTQTQFGSYPTCDRWRAQLDNASQATFTKETSGGPDGFPNFFKWNVDSADASVAVASNVYLQQRLEGFDLQRLGYGTSTAETLTMSFYVKGSRPGTYVLELHNLDSSRHVGQTYTIDAADTWEYKTITFPADTTGTFNDDNGESLRIKWWLQAGTNFTTGTLPTSWAAQSNVNNAAGQSINLHDTAGSNWNITGVQLEVGNTATPFQHEPYAKTLAKCQRYYQKIIRTPGVVGMRVGVGQAINSSNVEIVIPYPTTMRAAPTALEQTGTASDYGLIDATGTGGDCTSIPSFRFASIDAIMVRFTFTSHVAAGNASQGYLDQPDAYLAWSAEL